MIRCDPAFGRIMGAINAKNQVHTCPDPNVKHHLLFQNSHSD